MAARGQEQGNAPINLPPAHQLARDIFKELIEINTTDTPAGNVTPAAEAMAARFRAASFSPEDIQVLGPVANKKNLVVRFHGRGKGKPILFLAHLDVVQALRQDWSMDPFKLNEVDGYFYGRGTSDIKDGRDFTTTFGRVDQGSWLPKTFPDVRAHEFGIFLDWVMILTGGLVCPSQGTKAISWGEGLFLGAWISTKLLTS